MIRVLFVVFFSFLEIFSTQVDKFSEEECATAFRVLRKIETGALIKELSDDETGVIQRFSLSADVSSADLVHMMYEQLYQRLYVGICKRSIPNWDGCRDNLPLVYKVVHNFGICLAKKQITSEVPMGDRSSQISWLIEILNPLAELIQNGFVQSKSIFDNITAKQKVLVIGCNRGVYKGSGGIKNECADAHKNGMAGTHFHYGCDTMDILPCDGVGLSRDRHYCHNSSKSWPKEIIGYDIIATELLMHTEIFYKQSGSFAIDSKTYPDHVIAKEFIKNITAALKTNGVLWMELSISTEINDSKELNCIEYSANRGIFLIPYGMHKLGEYNNDFRMAINTACRQWLANRVCKDLKKYFRHVFINSILPGEDPFNHRQNSGTCVVMAHELINPISA